MFVNKLPELWATAPFIKHTRRAAFPWVEIRFGTALLVGASSQFWHEHLSSFSNIFLGLFHLPTPPSFEVYVLNQDLHQLEAAG